MMRHEPRPLACGSLLSSHNTLGHCRVCSGCGESYCPSEVKHDTCKAREIVPCFLDKLSEVLKLAAKIDDLDDEALLIENDPEFYERGEAYDGLRHLRRWYARNIERQNKLKEAM